MKSQTDPRDWPFIVDVWGSFTPGQVRILWRDESRPPHPEMDALIEREWAHHVERVTVRGGVLYNGPLLRYLRHRVEGGLLTLEAGPTDYANFFCTNYLHPEWGERFGQGHFSNPIGVSGTVITADGWLLQGLRNDRVASHAGCIHTFGGALDLNDRDSQGGFDAFGSIRRELREELGLTEAKIEELVCLGLIRDAQLRQPELVFDVRVRLSRDEVASRIQPDDPEHAGVVGCEDRPEAVGRFLAGRSNIVPIGVGALALHVRRRFGESAYRTLGYRG